MCGRASYAGVHKPLDGGDGMFHKSAGRGQLSRIFWYFGVKIFWSGGRIYRIAVFGNINSYKITKRFERKDRGVKIFASSVAAVSSRAQRSLELQIHWMWRTWLNSRVRCTVNSTLTEFYTSLYIIIILHIIQFQRKTLSTVLNFKLRYVKVTYCQSIRLVSLSFRRVLLLESRVDRYSLGVAIVIMTHVTTWLTGWDAGLEWTNDWKRAGEQQPDDDVLPATNQYRVSHSVTRLSHQRSIAISRVVDFFIFKWPWKSFSSSHCNFIIRMLHSDMYWLTLRTLYCFVFFACGSAFWHFCNKRKNWKKELN